MSDTNLYFLAIILPPEGSQQVTAIKEHFRDHYSSKAALRSPPHITLHMPFRWTEKKLDRLNKVLTNFAKEQKPMWLTLQNYQAFAPRVIYIDVVPNPQLNQLHNDLLATAKGELNLFNADYKDRPFAPHVTVAFRDLKKSSFHQAWEIFQSRKFDYEFLLEQISLLQHDGKCWELAQNYTFKSSN